MKSKRGSRNKSRKKRCRKTPRMNRLHKNSRSRSKSAAAAKRRGGGVFDWFAPEYRTAVREKVNNVILYGIYKELTKDNVKGYEELKKEFEGYANQ